MEKTSTEHFSDDVDTLSMRSTQGFDFKDLPATLDLIGLEDKKPSNSNDNQEEIDFISELPNLVPSMILSLLDGDSLAAAELVSQAWKETIADGMLWKKLIAGKIRSDPLWRGLGEKKKWIESFSKSGKKRNHSYYRQLHRDSLNDIATTERNWLTGTSKLQKIDCNSEEPKGVYYVQYDENKIVSGLRDNSIKFWDRATHQCEKVLTGHTGSVLCLQHNGKFIISGSSDSTVRIWDFTTGELINTLHFHSEAVLSLRFKRSMLVTCSLDTDIVVWDMKSPKQINVREKLVEHRAAVNAVDFDETFIVSASGDRTIKVWSTSTCELLKSLKGHTRGIACLQYNNGLAVSGSSDNSVRLWDVSLGVCLRVLEGHENTVRCNRMDSQRIISGDCDGKIKVWDLVSAMDPYAQQSSLCLQTLTGHTGRVFSLQFDAFQLVSSSADDTILIWDFLNDESESQSIPLTTNLN